jgi:hypothetical protein
VPDYSCELTGWASRPPQSGDRWVWSVDGCMIDMWNRSYGRGICPKCHFIRHKSHLVWAHSSVSPWWEIYCLSYDTAEIVECFVYFYFAITYSVVQNFCQVCPHPLMYRSFISNVLCFSATTYRCQVQFRDHELIPVRNSSFAAVQGSASRSNFR